MLKPILKELIDFRCLCGHSYTHHCGTGADVQSFASGGEAAEAEREAWHPGLNTKPCPTDAYGTIEFQGLPHPTKAQVSVPYVQAKVEKERFFS